MVQMFLVGLNGERNRDVIGRLSVSSGVIG